MEESVKKWLEKKKMELERTKAKLEEAEVAEREQGLEVKEGIRKVPIKAPVPVESPKPIASPPPKDVEAADRRPVFPPRQPHLRPKIERTGKMEAVPKPPKTTSKCSKWKGKILVAVTGCVAATLVFVIYQFFFQA